MYMQNLHESNTLISAKQRTLSIYFQSHVFHISIQTTTATFIKIFGNVIFLHWCLTEALTDNLCFTDLKKKPHTHTDNSSNTIIHSQCRKCRKKWSKSKLLTQPVIKSQLGLNSKDWYAASYSVVNSDSFSQSKSLLGMQILALGGT